MNESGMALCHEVPTRTSQLSFFFQNNPWGERYIPEVNRNGFTTVASSDYYRKELDIDLQAENTLYIVVGSDSGLLVKYLAGVELGNGTAVLIVESDNVYPFVEDECSNLANQRTVNSNSNNIQQVRLCAERDWESQIFNGSDSPWFLGGSVQIVQSQCCMSDYLNSYYALFRNVRQAVNERRADLKMKCDRKLFIDVQMLNAVDNVTPFPISSEFGKNRVAVVLAGGPSVDEHIDWIVKNRTKLFLVVVSRLCGKLNDLNIIPDIVVSIDPLHYMYDVSKVGVLWNDIPLVHSNYLTPALLQQWRGPHYYVGERLPWDGPDGSSTATVKSTGHTVGHTAIIVSAYLGFSTILLAGIDLCYNTSGTTHASGTPEAALLTLPSRYDAQVTTYSGRTAGTNLPLFRCIEGLESLGGMINRHRPVMYNISSEAACVPSIPFKDKQSFLLPRNTPKFESIEFTPSVEGLGILSTQFSQARLAFKNIERVCRKAQTCLNRIYGKDGYTSDENYRLRLAGLDKILESDIRHMQAIKAYESYELAVLRSPSGVGFVSAEEHELWLRQYYAVIEEGAVAFQQLIVQAEAKLTIRECELEEKTTIDQLSYLWKRDGTPGRAILYKERGCRQLSSVENEQLEQLVSDYVDSVFEENTSLSERVRDENSNIENCIRSVLFLYNQKSITDLETLSLAITEPGWPNNAIRDFIYGLARDLQGQAKDAISHFQAVIDACSEQLHCDTNELSNVHRLIEESLSCMTQLFLSMDDGESAIETLAILCEFCPQYISTYAKLLSSLGDSNSALELLAMYIENFPEDWRAERQIAELYESVGAIEESRAAFAHAEKTRALNLRDIRAAA